MAVEPYDRCRDTTEDNPVCDELIHLVDVETMIGCTVQSGKTFGKFICQRLLLTQVHASGRTMDATAITTLVTATDVSRWMVYDSPLELMKCPKGMKPATQVTAAIRLTEQSWSGEIRGEYVRGLYHRLSTFVPVLCHPRRCRSRDGTYKRRS